MDRKECSTGLQLIKVAAIKLKGRFSAVFIGALAMTTPLILCLFLGILMSILFNTAWVFTIGLVVFVLLAGPLQLGYIKYFNNVMDGNQPRIKQVYSYLRFSFFTLRSVYICGLLLVMYIIGGILWLVPAGFAVSAFSMVFFFMQKFEYPKLRTSMVECAKKMVGNRLTMFSYKLVFYLVYGMLFVVAGLCLVLVYNLLIESLLISWIVALCSSIVFIFLYTMVTVYYHSCNQIFFEDVLSRDEKKRQRKIQTTSNSTAQIETKEGNEEKKEDKVQSNEKQEKDKEEKKANKKSTEKKTTTKKTTSSKTKVKKEDK